MKLFIIFTLSLLTMAANAEEKCADQDSGVGYLKLVAKDISNLESAENQLSAIIKKNAEVQNVMKNPSLELKGIRSGRHLDDYYLENVVFLEFKDKNTSKIITVGISLNTSCDGKTFSYRSVQIIDEQSWYGGAGDCELDPRMC